MSLIPARHGTSRRATTTAAFLSLGALFTAAVPDAVARPAAAVPAAAVPEHGRLHDPLPVRPRKDATLARVAAEDTPIPASVNVLGLASRPEAERTIYLDFTGGAIPAGTLWSYADPIPYAPYSADGDPAVPSSEVERTAIYQAWQTVAEDFAPFNVNVTTANPGMDALKRDNDRDPRFGVHSIITPPGSPAHERTCKQTCGGVAVLDVMDMSTVQPVWVFSPQWQWGRGIGTTASHEIGHALGLLHDGQGAAEYYSGSNLWGPIMGGAMSNAALAHWSPGDYPDSTSPEQDDLAVIAESFPRLPDDHSGAEAPTPIGDTAVGVIGDRSDTDAFSFTTRGKVTISVAGVEGATNLDAGLSLTTPDGRTVAYEDNPPQSVWDIDQLPGYLPAVWRGDLGDAPVALVAAVDGVGASTPQASYSDYGSLGAYTVSVRPGPSAPRWVKERWSASQRHRWWSGVLRVTGSEGPVTITRAGDKPPGVRITTTPDGRTVRFRGWPQRVGVYRMRLTATDAWGDARTRKVTFRFTEFRYKHKGKKGDKKGGGRHR